MEWLNALVQGTLLGGLYALFAAGLSLIFGVMRLVNIAHGDLIVLSAYLGLSVTVIADGPTRRELRITRRGRPEPILVRSLNLLPNEPITLRAEDSLGDAGVALYLAELSAAGDLLDANNRLVLPVRGAEPTVLWIGGDGAGDPIAPPGWRVHPMNPPDCPARSEELLGIVGSVVVKRDRSVSEPQHELLDQLR